MLYTQLTFTVLQKVLQSERSFQIPCSAVDLSVFEAKATETTVNPLYTSFLMHREHISICIYLERV